MENYKDVHVWLNKTYGKANVCENIGCPDVGYGFEYALKKGSVHLKKRENYLQLCVKCHRNYDFVKPEKVGLKVKMLQVRITKELNDEFNIACIKNKQTKSEAIIDLMKYYIISEPKLKEDDKK